MNLFPTMCTGLERNAEAFAEHTQAGIDRILNGSPKRSAATAPECNRAEQEGSSPTDDAGTAGVVSLRAKVELHLGKPIVTTHVYPPIPCRDHDWCAYPDGEEENGDYGWGPTEDEAIDDLVVILQDNERIPETL